MWSYEQITGFLSHNGEMVGKGYSGHGEGLNNPNLERVHDVGPIPEGLWIIGAWHDEQHLGPCVATLKPVDHDAYGRTDFLVHGDDASQSHRASHGCIIMGATIRHVMRDSGDTALTVIREQE